MELFVNAIEHGNLGIGYEEKTRLLREATLSQEIERRLELPENADKRVRVEIEKSGNRASVTEEDQGPGCEYEKYLGYEEGRSLHAHGRGILLSGTLFDLTYLPPGNRVRALIRFYGQDRLHFPSRQIGLERGLSHGSRETGGPAGAPRRPDDGSVYS